ncbi:MAG: three-Cys-motif partner protein TcmP [Bacteroidales bacterium]|jgi:three-Cys-motif partner protein|nr:three-Cys-motif partner protein TcmP [Bacteroidales bacterium]
MKTKSDVKNTLQIHSQAKVEFYAAYLKRYLRILCFAKPINQVNIYDVFCGMGIYDDGGKGSPIIAFDTIKDVVSDEKFKETNTQITLVVNDIEQQKIEQVKKYIEYENQNFCNVRYYNCDIEQMFNIVQQKVSSTATDTRNLIFIDPYGYKNIKKEMLYQLMINGRTEIILFLPISHMHRFTQKAIHDEETVQYEPLRKFVNSFFCSSHKIIKEHIPVMEYIQFITEALKFNKFYTTSYYIERDVANYFALFFMSSHIFGFEKILEVKWQLDEEAGRGFKIPSMQKGFFDDYFAQETKEKNAAKLESMLLERLTLPRTNKQIYEETLKYEFLPKHTTEIFKTWQLNNPKFKVYDIKTRNEARKGAFYISYDHYKESEAKVQFKMEKQ